MCAVGFFGERIESALQRQARQLLGADLLLVADHRWSNEIAAQARSAPYKLDFAQTAIFSSMLQVDAAVQLVSVKAVSEAYPLRGRLHTAGALGETGRPVTEVPAPGEVWPEERLAAVLGLHVGDSVQLGARRFQVSRILTLEPDRGANFLNVSPRLLMNWKDIPATGLIGPGARVRYRLMFAGEAEAVSRFRDAVAGRLGRGERIEDVNNARPEVRVVLERGVRFFKLASLLCALLAAVAVALSSERYMARHLDGYAIMRCMGAQNRDLFGLHLQQMLWLGVLCGAAGAGLGFGAHFALYESLSGLLNLQLPWPSLLPALQGFAVAGLLLLGFAVPPLLQLRRVSTLRVLRREYGPALGDWQAVPIYAYAFGAALMAGMVFWIANDARLALYVNLGMALILGSLILIARVGLWSVARLMRRGEFAQGFGARRAFLEMLTRPWGVSLQIAALALALLALFLLAFVQRELLHNWKQSLTPDTPNRFLINIQPRQLSSVADLLRQYDVDAPLVPMVRARLLQVNKRPVSGDDYPDNPRAQRLVEREFGLSWSDALPLGNQITAGRWPRPGERNVATVERGLAEQLGIAVGSRLQFSVAGQLSEVNVVGLRKLRWDSLRPNFFVMTSPADLQGFPVSYIGSFRVKQQDEALARELVARFPNLTLIDISNILQQLVKAIAQVSQAVNIIFLFSVFAGLLVLYIAQSTAFSARERGVAVMRALGASRTQVRTPLLCELMLVGAVAGLLAGIAAVLCGGILNDHLLQLESDLWSLATWWPVLVAMLAGALFSLVVGAKGVRDLLNTPPALALREA